MNVRDLKDAGSRPGRANCRTDVTPVAVPEAAPPDFENETNDNGDPS